VAFTAEAAETSQALKGFLHTRVYSSDALGADRRQSMTRIAELFQFFLAHPERMPQPYARQTLDEPAHRVVCDYIAGMTDGFFSRTYESMLG
jgi:dGTPase